MAGPQQPVSSDATDLAQFGYKQALERRTGRFASFAVAFAFVSIATGIFTTYGSVLNTSGPAGIWTWLSSGNSRWRSSSARWPPASR